MLLEPYWSYSQEAKLNLEESNESQKSAKIKKKLLVIRKS